MPGSMRLASIFLGIDRRGQHRSKNQDVSEECVCMWQWLAQRFEDLQREIIWLKERSVQTDAQLATVLGQMQVSDEEEERRKLKRSNSYFGMFGLSR